MKIFSKFLILLLTVVSVFSIKNVSADTPDIVIKDMSISEKSDTIIVNDYGFNGTTMNSDVTFYDIGDYVTYKIVLKNNTSNTYSINGLTDNNENSNVTYEYNSNEEKVLEANKELDIYITVKYTTELAPGEISVSTGNIDIVLDMSEVKNPNTSDNIIMLFIMLTLSVLAVILIKNKKAKYLTVIAISLGLLISTVLAKETFKLTLNSTCNVVKTTTFKTGKEVRQKMSELLGLKNAEWIYKEEYGYYYLDGEWDEEKYDVGGIQRVSFEEYEEVKDYLTEDNIVSTEDSKYPIYMWSEEIRTRNTRLTVIVPPTRKIYYYTDADKIYLNSDASYMFYNLDQIQELDVNGFDTSKVTNMSYMFAGCNDLTSLDVSGFDTLKVTNMSHMFNWCGSLTELDVSSFDTSQVTNMSYMFAGCNSLTSLDVSSFNTSKVTNMSYMFAWCNNLTELDVSGFDVSHVTDMTMMFAYTNLSSDIISTWVIPAGCNTNDMFRH